MIWGQDGFPAQARTLPEISSIDLEEPRRFEARRFRGLATAEDAVTGATALLFLLAFFLFRNAYIRFSSALPDYEGLLFITSLVAAHGFRHVTYEQFPAIFSVLARVTSIGVLVYLLAEPSVLTLAEPQLWKRASYVNSGYWAAVLAAVVSLSRPSFAFSPAFYVLSTRYLSEKLSGFNHPVTDVKYIMEMSELLACAACGASLMRAIQARWQRPNSFFRFVNCDRFALCIAFCAIGIHLGNYFWSGIAKLTIGPHPWSWALENPTQNLMLGALKKGVLPLGGFPEVTQWVFDAFGSTVQIVNLFVLSVQLLALIAAVRVRWLVWSSVAYDLFHVGTYVLGGLFFWPWVWNNVSILIALRGRSDAEIGWLPKFCCIGALIAGQSHYLSDSVRLGWFDVADIKATTIQAQGEDGRWMNVPGAFFMSHSHAIGRGYLDMERAEGHYPPSVWNAVFTYDRLGTSGRCVAPGPVSNPATKHQREARLERVRKFIVAHHIQMIERTKTYGSLFYYFRPQHYPSNPQFFSDFNGVDLQKIRRYRLLTESVCLNLERGMLKEHSIKQDQVLFDVK
jgi:hypothetical protein